MTVGILVSFWDGLFSGAMLVSGSVLTALKPWKLTNMNKNGGSFWMMINPYYKKTWCFINQHMTNDGLVDFQVGHV